jgi:hypothetical protein
MHADTLIAAFIFLIALYYVLEPLFSTVIIANDMGDYDEQKEKHDLLLEGLLEQARDVELDHTLHKMEDADYMEQREQARKALSKAIKLGGWALCILLGSSQTVTWATSDSMMPDVPRGVIQGRLWEGNSIDKKPLGNHAVTLFVFQGEQRILALEKSTNPKGEFEFSHVFRSPEFAYVLMSHDTDYLYMLSKMSLGADEESKFVELFLSPDSPHKVMALSDAQSLLESVVPAPSAQQTSQVQSMVQERLAKDSFANPRADFTAQWRHDAPTRVALAISGIVLCAFLWLAWRYRGLGKHAS